MFFDCGSSAHGTEERDLRSKNNLETICFSQGSLKHSSSFMDHAYIYIYTYYCPYGFAYLVRG